MRYVCRICGYVYDNSKEAVPFEKLPETWKCPLCGASKQDFEPEKKKQPEKAKPKPEAVNSERRALSVGQMSALCSNLARGCEKQYLVTESRLFSELATYFANITPPVEDDKVETVFALLQQDIDSYGDVRAVADQNADRGAARVCVWGEKVTRMLSSLVGRYLREGEAMLANTNIWVCTVCGFVYVGDDAPDLCPVCKVPAWKFEKMERRA